MSNVNEIQILLSTTSFYCRLDRAPLLKTQFESLQPLSTLPENTARQDRPHFPKEYKLQHQKHSLLQNLALFFVKIQIPSARAG